MYVNCVVETDFLANHAKFPSHPPEATFLTFLGPQEVALFVGCQSSFPQEIHNAN